LVGGLLLTRQLGSDEALQLPGGGIDPGESPIAALHREVFEETGWSITKPRRIGAFRRFVFMPEYDRWAEKVCTIYIARPVRPLGAPIEPDHVAEIVPVELAQESLANSGDQLVLRSAIKRRLVT
jgi:8-oxo-dGTP diphosphatase